MMKDEGKTARFILHPSAFILPLGEDRE